MFCLLFCLYLTLPLDFGVYHREYHSYLLLVLQGTVGAQIAKIKRVQFFETQCI